MILYLATDIVLEKVGKKANIFFASILIPVRQQAFDFSHSPPLFVIWAILIPAFIFIAVF